VNDCRGRILRLAPNRVWRTYSGGLFLDRIDGKPSPADGDFPEDWLGSTVRAINPGRSQDNEGLARVTVGDSQVFLADLIASDPEYFLGKAHLNRFGVNSMILLKYLDAVDRLPIQVHPTVAFSRKHLNTMSGKTEAYYILATRPEVVNPFIYLGFQRPPSRRELRRMIVDQDIGALESCFDKIPVKPGDVFLVPGGLPHSIGGGVFMVELMEPTDYVARVEFKIGNRVVPESARFMERDVDFALDMFSFESWPLDAVQGRWRCQPRLLDQTEAMRRESLVDERSTDRFRMTRTIIAGRCHWRCHGFTILIVIEGTCSIETAHERVVLSQYDRFVVPCGLEQCEIVAKHRVVLLESCGPSVEEADHSS
jgi:mannose-6-phosphate isomerase